MRTTPVLRAFAATLAAAYALPATATATDLAPVAQCTFADQYKFVAYGGYAYTTGPEPLRLTLTCSVDNGFQHHVSEISVERSPAVLLPAFAPAYQPDPWLGCTTAVAEYAGGVTATTNHCRYLFS